MPVSREAIHAALFSLVSSVPGVTTASRTLKHWSDVPASQQPALFQAHKGEAVDAPARGAPQRWTMRFDLYLYANTASDPNAAPSSVLNPLLDKIQAALAPGPSGVQTLGDMVHHCWIAGSIETDEGVLGDQGVVIIPVEVLISQ